MPTSALKMKTKGIKKVSKKGKKAAPKLKKNLSTVSTNEFFDQDFENAGSDDETAETKNEVASEFSKKKNYPIIIVAIKHSILNYLFAVKKTIVKICRTLKIISGCRICWSNFFTGHYF